MKNIRIVFALAVILLVVFVAQGAGAWTEKLAGNNVVVAVAPREAGARPAGTVGGSSSTGVGGAGPTAACTLVATYCVTSAQTGLAAEAITELPADVTGAEKAVATRMVQIKGEGKTSEAIFFTLKPALGTGEKVAYWDGAQWVDLTLVDGKYEIPTGAALPLYIAVFTN